MTHKRAECVWWESSKRLPICGGGNVIHGELYITLKKEIKTIYMSVDKAQCYGNLTCKIR